jgi:hypothetical protein
VTRSLWQGDGLNTELGADVRWNINQDVFFNATINPDFSQVEADGAQLSLNQQFSLFFPELRTFFVEGAESFNTPNRLVYTRNIATPDFGAKLTGRSDAHTYGVIVANDTETGFLLPGNQGSSFEQLDDTDSQVLIGRWQTDVGERDAFGALITHRQADGYSNTVAAVDTRVWFSDRDFLTAQWISTEAETPDDSGTIVQSGDAFSLNYEYEEADYSWFLRHRDFAEDFRADLGFIPRVGYYKSDIGGRLRWFLDDGGFFNFMQLRADYDVTYTQDGRQLEEELEAWFRVRGKSQLSAFVGLGRRRRLVETDFSLEFAPTGTDTSAPDYIAQFDDFQLSEYFYETFLITGFEVQPNAEFQFGLRGRFSDQIDVYNVQLGTVQEFRPEIQWRVNENMVVNLNYIDNTLNVDGGELFHAKIADLRLSYQFDLRHRLRAAVVYNNITRTPELYNERYRNIPNIDDYIVDSFDQQDRSLGLQFIYSYLLNPRTLAFVGYSSSAFQNDSLSGLKQEERSFFAKFSYAFQI